MKNILITLLLIASCSSPVPDHMQASVSLNAPGLQTIPGFTTRPGTSYDARNWNITGTVVLTSGVTWKGGTFTGTGPAFISNGNCVGVNIDSVVLTPSVAYLFEGNVKPFVTYNGSDSTFLYKNVTASHIRISGKTTLYNGTYEWPKTFHDVNFGMTITDVVKNYDSTSENLLVVGHSIYKFRWSNWTLIGNTRTGLVDNGVVQINSGNGQGNNCYRSGKQYGYWMRCWGVKLGADPDQDVRVENMVDAGTVCYGSLDFRIDPSYLQSNAAIALTGVNAWFVGNNSAYKEDMNNGYVTSAVVLGQTVDDLGKIDTVHIKNSIAVAAHVSAMAGGSSLLKNNSSGRAVIDSSGNIDIAPGLPVPAGILDNLFYSLVPGKGAHGTTVQPVPPSVSKDTVYITIHDTITAHVKYATFDSATWHYHFDNGTIQ